MKSDFKHSRRFRQGTAATAITLCVLAALVLLNLVVGALNDRYGLTLDMTGQKLYSLSPGTLDLLASLDRDVDIYVINSEEGYTADNTWFLQSAEVLKKYGRASDRVTVTFVDYLRNPGFASRYPELNLELNMVLVTCGDQVVLLDPEDFFNITVDEWGFLYITSAKVEQTLTTVISGLVSDQVTGAVLLTGHNESEAGGLVSLLAMNRYQVTPVSLISGEIPEDTGLVILSAPQADYAEVEIKKLEEFLYNGGAYGRTLFYMAAVDQPPLPNLSAFLEEWGIRVGDGAVFETDINRLVGNSSLFLPTADFAEETYSKVVQRSGLPIYLPNSRPLEALPSATDSLRVETLLEFSETAGIRPSSSPAAQWTPSPEEVQGPFPALLLAQRGNLVSEEGPVSSVLAVSTSLAVEQSILAEPVFSNGTYFLSLISTLMEREDTVPVETKRVDSGFLGITYAAMLIWGTVFTVVLPVAVLACGTVVFLRRRSL